MARIADVRLKDDPKGLNKTENGTYPVKDNPQDIEFLLNNEEYQQLLKYAEIFLSRIWQAVEKGQMPMEEARDRISKYGKNLFRQRTEILLKQENNELQKKLQEDKEKQQAEIIEKGNR